MFDEPHLISQCLKRIRRQTRPFIRDQSAFNQSLDKRLRKLAFLYKFNFEAVALHLIEEFPQYQYKISKASIAYRWYQMEAASKPCTLKGPGSGMNEDQGLECQKKQGLSLSKDTSRKNFQDKLMSSQQSEQLQAQAIKKHFREEISEKSKQAHEQKLSQLQKVLIEAQKLADNQSSCFIAYIDSQLRYRPNYLKTYLSQCTPGIGSGNNPLQQVRLQEFPVGGSLEPDGVPVKKEDDLIYEYDYNYRQLQEEYNHYNEVVRTIGYGFHEDSATDESGSTSEEGSEKELEIQEEEGEGILPISETPQNEYQQSEQVCLQGSFGLLEQEQSPNLQEDESLQDIQLT